jgi:hypothetical protein
MATSNKIIIPSSALPAVNEKLDSYYVRYRITSEDKNSFSAWSPIMQVPTYAVENEDYSATGQGQIEYITNSKQVTASWPLTQNVFEYDVWFKWQLSSQPSYIPSWWKELSQVSLNPINGDVTYTTVNPHGYALRDIVTISNTDVVYYNLEDELITSIPTPNTFVINVPGYIGYTTPPYIGSGYAKQQTWTYKGRISGNKVDFYQSLNGFSSEQLFSIRVYVPHSPITHNTDYLIFARLNYPTNYAT